MEPSKPTTSLPSSNPPSVEIAYKRKSIALKKRLNEVESENELMRVRNKRGWKYVQKMRLESCMLLERLAKVTGMAEEAQAGSNPELRARAAAMMSNTAALNGIAADGGQTAGNGAGYFEDETEGSSDEQPPTVSFPVCGVLFYSYTDLLDTQPQERPLRVKRSRKSNANNDGGDEEVLPPVNNNNTTNNTANTPAANNMSDPAHAPSASLPRLAPAPSQEEMTSSFRIQTGSNGSVPPERDSYPATTTTPAATTTAAAGAYNHYPHDEHNSHQSYHPLHSGLDQPPQQPAPEPSTTPMDVDTKDVKEES